jgi:hypothetical protein
MLITSLKSRVGREQALRLLSSSGMSRTLRRWLTGDLILLADIYIPYRLYKIVCEDPKSQSARCYAIDALSGLLDPYQFSEIPVQSEFVGIETQNPMSPSLDESRTRELAIEKARRVIFSRGFFRLAHPRITAELIQPELYIPYWAGFYGNKQDLSIVVLDSVRRTIEGRKVAHAIKEWLLDEGRTNAQHGSEQTSGAATESKGAVLERVRRT